MGVSYRRGPALAAPRLGTHAAARATTCPQCGAPAGRPCRSTSGTPSRGGYTHVARRAQVGAR